MNSSTPSAPELVGLLHDRDTFETTVENLLACGFARTDISVLSSHESLEVAGKPAKPIKDVLTALVGEIRYEGPLVVSGGVFLAGGPIGEAIGLVVGAAIGTTAIKEVISEVTSTPHTEDFARAVEAGSIIIWVRTPGEAEQEKAREVLLGAHAENVHLYQHQTD